MHNKYHLHATNMSTFDGRVKEFPEIRIDYFRVREKEQVKPLAFFLSHVHSDHLQGLETCKAPFIYCSPVTRAMLLRLEKYPHRMNFAKGILEARKQTYKHLRNLLKPIALHTPTMIELTPGRHIRVTLFDANHCTGACIILIEDDKHAIIYTGDIRSEQWWVDSLARHPLFLPYVCQNDSLPIRRLDCIYLDTTFATSMAQCRRFDTKQQGITELLKKVAAYPKGTIFYLDSWTFGYEDVWVALSAFLQSPVHLDEYRYKMYHSLSNVDVEGSSEQHQLIGYRCGNHYQKGCLSEDQDHLIHACEYGAGCPVFEKDHVRITPIISRHEGQEILEVGAGGGQYDLERHELELDDEYLLHGLIALCKDRLADQPAVFEQIQSLLLSSMSDRHSAIPLDFRALHADAEAAGMKSEALDELPLEALVPAIVKLVDDRRRAVEDKKLGVRRYKKQELRPDGLPARITFPYSRHSSYDELRFVIQAFMPVEIYPCTVNLEDWSEADSMGHLFGDLYSPDKTFYHDGIMRRRDEVRRAMLKHRLQQSRMLSEVPPEHKHPSPESPAPLPAVTEEVIDVSVARNNVGCSQASVLSVSTNQDNSASVPHIEAEEDTTPLSLTPISPPSVKKALQREAYSAARREQGRSWSEVELVSTSGHGAEEEL